MTTPAHVRDHVYGIVAHPTMSAEQKAEMLKRVADATTAVQKTTPVYPAPTMAMATPAPGAPPAPPAVPTAAFSTAPALPPIVADTPFAKPSATASFSPAPPNAANEIDRQQALALAALAKPTAYPTPKATAL